MKRLLFLLLILMISVVFVACSDEERVNPEDFLVDYITAWENQEYAHMVQTLHQESATELEQKGLDLPERMGEIHEIAEVQDIQVSFESRDFEEEEIDLDETEELIYSVDVQLNSVVGELQYMTDVTLTKELSEVDGEEVEEWLVTMQPSHIFMGLQSFEDTIAIDEGDDPVRGEIFDRNGRPLAVHAEVYNAGFVPEVIEDFDDATERFAELLHLDVDRVRRLTNAYPDNPDWFAPVTLMSLDDPRRDELLEIKGILLNRKEDGRDYPYGEALSHLVGYIGDITAEELEDRPGEGYKTDSLIGKRGVELAFEEQLRGTRGFTIAVKDAEGDTKDVIKTVPTEDGEDITLTIDAELQQQLVDTIGDDEGTGVVMDPTTGEILALASLPAYDSNLRYLGLGDPRMQDAEDINIFYTQRYRNAYSPGSVFKPITGAIGLEEGTLDPDEVFTIDGKYWQPDSSWGDYEIARVNENVSEVDFETAMTYSDNIYFAMQALEIGQSNFEAWAEKLGFGDDIPFDYPISSSSIANEDLSSEVLLADTGYGQGQAQISPIHLTSLYTMFLNDGNVIQPQILDGTGADVWIEGAISPETTDTVLNNLISVVEDSNGTAYRSNPGHTRSIAGKTGTAELKESRDDEGGDRLGWYVAFDYENRDLLVTLMIQNEASGYSVDKVNEFLSSVGE